MVVVVGAVVDVVEVDVVVVDVDVVEVDVVVVVGTVFGPAHASFAVAPAGPEAPDTMAAVPAATSAAARAAWSERARRAFWARLCIRFHLPNCSKSQTGYGASVIRKALKAAVALGFLAVIALLVKRFLVPTPASPTEGPPPAPAPPSPPQATSAPVTPTPAPAEPSSSTTPPPQWTDPVDATCPASHPVKAKLKSRVFRRPGAPGYDASVPDRCYVSAEAAEVDGFHEAKR